MAEAPTAEFKTEITELAERLVNLTVKDAQALVDCLNKMGHHVTVYEKYQKVGGLLRYGIPDFKLEKRIIGRRIDIMVEEGVNFETGVCVGEDIFMEYLQNKPIPSRDF